MADRRPVSVLTCRLGLMPYDQAIALELKLRELRHVERLSDMLLLMEHPPTVTMGRFAKDENVLVSPEELARKGVVLCRSNRGGDATFHCPGQLIVHPVMDLRRREGVLRGFITDIEEAALMVLHGYGIAAERWSEHPGLWVSDRQIGAIGLNVSRGISMHGLAINVDPDLSTFGIINLCGLPGRQATSMARELGQKVSMDEVAAKLLSAFTDVFQAELIEVPAPELMERAELPCAAPS